ncbi:MAG: PilZ domain-containing protein [Candidatus Omnitrophota bacterium]
MRNSHYGFYVLCTALILPFVFSSALEAEEARDINATRILINTSGPVAYRHQYQSNPPRITFQFFNNTVYSDIQESVSIQKGIVKHIEAAYFKKYPVSGLKRPLKTLTFYLAAESAYEVFEGPESILLVIRHPEGMPEGGLGEGKVLLSTMASAPAQSAVRQEELAEALQRAMVKMTPAEPRPVAAGTLQASQRPGALQKHSAVAAPSSASFASLVPSAPTLPSQRALLFFSGGLLLFFILGGLMWPPSWFSIQNRLLRREQRQSWEMAKKIIALKEESVAHEEESAKEAAFRAEELRSLQSQIALFQEANLKLQEKSASLSSERECLQKALLLGEGDIHNFAQERVEMMERLEAVQSELRSLSARYDQEISNRRQLESEMEYLKNQEKDIASRELGEEKRQWTRLPIFSIEKPDLPLTVEVQGPSGRIIYGYPKDISLGGISFELKENVELPSPLSMTLFFPKRKSGLETEGKVAWKVQEGERSWYGVRFLNLPRSGTDLLNQFLKERFPQMRDAGWPLIEDLLKEKNTGKVSSFTYSAPQAGAVSLVGDFNHWDPDKHPMKKMRDGTWRIALHLPPGSYQYQFYVDGVFCMDPDAKAHTPNAFGTENALIEVSEGFRASDS